MIKKVGDNIKSDTNKKWTFDKKTSKNFDNHIVKSVPGYEFGHNIIISIANDSLSDNSKVLDVGCSTGTLLRKLSKQTRDDTKFIGIDISKNMIRTAKNYKNKNIKYYLCKIQNLKEKNFDLIISYYTMQFLPHKNKLSYLKYIYNKLVVGGKFIIFEKVINNQNDLMNVFDHAYKDFKINNGFSETEIYNKEELLRGVLFTNSREKNFDLFQKSKFQQIQVIQQNLMFEGYIMAKY